MNFFTKKTNILITIIFLISQLNVGQITPKNDIQANEILKKATNALTDLKCKESLKYAQIGLEYALKNNKYSQAANIYNIIGLNYEQISEIKQAEKHYLTGLKYAELANDNDTKEYINNNLGNLYYYNLNEPEKGIIYYNKTLKYTKKNANPLEIAFVELNIASAYFKLKNYKEGFKYLNKIENTVEKAQNFEMSISFYTLQGNYYSHKENNTIAENYFLKAIELLKNNKDEYLKANEAEIYDEVYAFYKKTGNTKKALFYLEKHDNLEDELNNKEKDAEIKLSTTNIEVLETNDKIQKIEELSKIQEQKIKQSEIVTTTTLVFSAILFLFLLIFLKNFFEFKKLNIKLTESNVQLKLANEKSNEASKLKSQFLSNVSHELRTPLYGVIGMADILENEFKEIKNSQYFNALKFSSNYLLTLINDVLNVYKIEDSKFEFNYENIDIRKEIFTIKETLNIIAKSNDNTINIEISENVPTLIKTDLTRFSQILINLVSNSLKFTKKGIVIIKLELESLQNKQVIKIDIIDTGMGIPEEFLPIIFDKFIQVDVNLQEQYKGTGLGLSIVKKLVELFNGTITVTSVIEKGTVFTLKLPYLIANELEKNTNDKPKPFLITQNKLKILIVEDNKINQMVTKKLLEKNNHNCEIVENGLEALNILKKKSFDLILMDINMPIMNGFEASKKIRKNNNLTPIIALTASDKEDVLKGIKLNGLNDILVKPFEISELNKIINKYVN